MYEGRNFIDGHFIKTRADFVTTNPSTEEIVGRFPQSTEEEVKYAIDTARRALPSWKAKSRIARAELFDKLCDVVKKRKEELAEIISIETGKSLNESRAEVMESLHMAQYTFGMGRMPCGDVVSSEIAEKDCYVIRKPKGVVAVIGPWNFPSAILGFWSAAPALLEGNTVVMKPSEDTPWVGQIVAELYRDAGFPLGVINLIHGDGKVGDMLVKGNVDHICFTGSAEVGQHIRRVCAESWHKTCSCEMGSKSAVIVFDDADFELSMSACLASAYKLTGQRCVSAGRLLIQRNIYSKFCQEFATRSSKITTGNPLKVSDPFFMGPLINEKQLKRVEEFNDMVRKCPKANVILDGKREDRSGYFLRPFVYQTEWREKEERPFLKQEVFGPHVAIVPFENVEDAIRIYNDTAYGLSCAVCTTDYRKMRAIRDKCDFGLGYVNLPSVGAESHLPFGGTKKSGNGWPSAAGMFDAVVHKVAWTVNHDVGFQMAQGLKV